MVFVFCYYCWDHSVDTIGIAQAVVSDRATKYLPLQFSTHASFRSIEISLDIALETSQRLFTTITESCLNKIYFYI